jgi:hypothetical protein
VTGVQTCALPISSGRRKGGRPKLTWAEGIRGMMEEKGLMEADWNDRIKWRKKIV